MDNEPKSSSRCPLCDSPPEAGHMPGCKNGPAQADTRLQEHFEVEEALSDEDRDEFFRLYGRINGLSGEALNKKTTSFNEYVEEKHLFIIREGSKQIIAGAAVEIQSKEDRKEAYFRMKVVDEKYRGKSLASLLTKRRLKAAQEAGCAEVWASVGGEDSSALRTIFKDGFVITAMIVKEPDSQSPDNFSYRASRDLTIPEPGSISDVEARGGKVVGKEDEISGDKLLIPWQNQGLIQKALSQGYIARQLFFPGNLTELPDIKENVLYFEKADEKEHEK